LLASSWVLNHTEGPERHVLYPFALHFSNLHSRKQQLRQVRIPDVHPATAMMEAEANEAIPFGTMNMTAGDFVVLYSSPSNQEIFDAVTTVFFVDTAPNIIRYIEAIHHCLKPNGVWINVGPLLWHFEDSANRYHSESGRPADHPQHQGIGEPGSVELTEEEVMNLVKRMGFSIEKPPTEERPMCGYIQDPESMLQNLYQPSHWVARKKQ